jgi:hypothetical protein
MRYTIANHSSYLMQPKVFVVQPMPEIAPDLLREESKVTVYPFIGRHIRLGELAVAATRSDRLFALRELNVNAEVINASLNPKGPRSWLHPIPIST